MAREPSPAKGGNLIILPSSKVQQTFIVSYFVSYFEHNCMGTKMKQRRLLLLKDSYYGACPLAGKEKDIDRDNLNTL